MARRDAADLLQLPNWDEVDPVEEELDYGEDDDIQGQEHVEDASPSVAVSPSIVEEPCSSSSRSQQIPQINSSEHLPRMGISDESAARPSRNIGPALPPGFSLEGGMDDAAPEDPSDDPEDPGMAQQQPGGSHHVIGPSLPRFDGPSNSPPPQPSSSRSMGPSLPNGSSRHSPPGPHIGPSLPFACHPAAPIGPSLPPSDSMAPTLPDDELRSHSNSNSHSGDSLVLPPPEPSMAAPSSSAASSRTIGPAMPPDLLPSNGVNENDNNNAVVADVEVDEDDLFGPVPPPPADQAIRGPSLPPEMPFDEEDDEEVIGPMPPGQDMDRAAEEYALRVLALERQKEVEKNATKREEWMTQLPKKLANYGLGPRTFNKGSAPGEKDSSWTETPAQKRLRLERGESEPSTSGQQDMNAHAQRLRDEEQERMASQINKTRNESLMDSHLRKRKTEQDQSNGDGEPSGRQGFDRERDMEVRGLKGATAAEIKERCGALSNRFGNSNNQKFL